MRSATSLKSLRDERGRRRGAADGACHGAAAGAADGERGGLVAGASRDRERGGGRSGRPGAARGFVAACPAFAEVLPGDGYDDYIKPFRTLEDVHVHLALGAFLLGDSAPHWERVEPGERARWQRDQALLQIADSARAARTEAAWRALGER